MRKVLSSVNLLLFSFFLSSSHLALAWNGACYSPVQMASLLSKPKKKSSNTGKIRKSIRGLEKSIGKIEERLNSEEGRLADSLNGGKLKENPSAVAGQIRSYIEAQQNSWDCDDETAKLLFKKYPLLFQSPLLFEILWQAFVPPAFGGKGENKRNGTDESKLVDLIGTLTEKERCENKGDQYKWDGDKCVLKCPKADEYWDGAKCIEYDKKQKENCKKSGRKWADDEEGVARCVCPNGQRWDGSKCVDTEYTKCKKQNRKWDPKSGKCIPLADHDEALAKNNEIRKKECDSRGEQYKWDGDKCVLKCPKADEYWDGAKCIEYDKKQKEKCAGGDGKWVDDDEEGARCVCLGGRRWDGKKCVDTKDTCEKKGAQYKWHQGQCVLKCPEEDKYWNTDSEKCEKTCREGETWFEGRCLRSISGEADIKVREETDGPTASWEDLEKNCKDRGDQWGWDKKERKCVSMCEEPDELWDSINEKCVSKVDSNQQKGACESKGDQWFWNGAVCLYKCPEWKKHPAFGSKGKVSKSFCRDFAKSRRECERALDRLKKLLRSLDQLESKKTRAENSLHKTELFSLKDSEKKTEAGGLCFSCLKRVLAASQPSTGQQVGNFLKALTGAGLGLVGYNEGRRAQWDANMMRIQQTHAPQNDYYSMMGASAGFPYMAQGFYGMTRANTPAGGWACSPTMSPFGQTNYQYGQGINMVYY